MKTVKKTADYTVMQRGDGRYAVRGDNKWINGEAKVELLVKEGLLTRPEPKPAPAPEEADEGPGEETGDGET